MPVRIVKKALIITAVWCVSHGIVASGQYGWMPAGQPAAAPQRPYPAYPAMPYGAAAGQPSGPIRQHALAPGPAASPWATAQPARGPIYHAAAASPQPAVRVQHPTDRFAHAGPTRRVSEGGQVFANPYVNSTPSPRPHAAPGSTLLTQAMQLEAAGQIPAALDRYHRAMQSCPTDWHTLVSVARAKHRCGDLPGAIAVYRNVLSYHPNDPIALNDLGLCYARQGDLRQAITSLRAAADVHPESKRYRNNLATVLIEANDLNGALSTLREVHGEAIAHFNLGFLLSQRERHGEAVGELQKALRLDPSLAPARQLLSQLPNQEAQIATRPPTPGVPTPANPHSAPADSTPTDEPTPATRPLILKQSAEMSEGQEVSISRAHLTVELDRRESEPGVPPDPADYRIPGLLE